MTKTFLQLLLSIAGMSSTVAAQATPAVTSSSPYQPFTLPNVQGTLHYSISASERINPGYNGSGSTASATTLSGNLGYLSQSLAHPFSLVYSGGVLGGNVNQPTSFFHTLALSQVLPIHRWSLVLADSISYLPQTATSGLSGIQGVGDAGTDPVQVGSATGLGILSKQSNRISNTASGSIQRPITGSTSLHASASESLLRFVDNSSENGGNDTTQKAFGAGFNHRLDARTSYGVNYSFSRATFGGSSFSFDSQAVNFGFTRQLSRSLAIDVSLGPQRTSGSEVADPSLNLSAIVSAIYTKRYSGLSFSYFSGTSSGSGVSTGARSQSLQGSVHRSLGPFWNVSLDGGYNRSSSIPTAAAPSFNSNSTIGEVQVNRALRHGLSLFLSYSAQHQTFQGAGFSTNSLIGLSQIVSAGLTYSPESMHLGHR